MAVKQKYGIKFPFQIQSDDKTFLDLNDDALKGLKSQLVHLIFTPQGQRLRNPGFGTRLIQFIFNPNDNQTWSDVVMEIKDTVKQFIPNCTIENIEVGESDNGLNLYVKVVFGISIDGRYVTDEIIQKL